MTNPYDPSNQPHNGNNETTSFDPASYSQSGYAGMPPMPPASQPYGQQPATGSSQDSFFKALFDFSFTRYATPSVVKVIYIILFVLISLAVLFGVIAALVGAANENASTILLIPFVILFGIVGLAVYRVGLEVSLSIIRTAQSVQAIDQREARQEQAGGQFPGSYQGPFQG